MSSRVRDNLQSYLSSSEAAQMITSQINTEGYIVLPGVFSEKEADDEYRRMWHWVQTVSPSIRKSDPSTWRRRRGDAWPCKQRDMMQLHQAGWVFNDLREAMAGRVFEKIYGTKELHCSKDGFTLQRPTEEELGQSHNDHYDQGFHSRGLQCIQGSVALTDQEHDDGCFLCWPRSHLVHDEMMDWRGPKRGREDFVILDEKEREWLQSQGFEPKRVPVNRGDVILWRSDLVHKGAPPIGRRDNFRAVVYICMLPAVLTPESVYRDKQIAYEQIQTGCHWPNREEWFQTRKEASGMRPYFKKPPQLSLRQQQLYGLVRYTSPVLQETITTFLKAATTQAASTMPDVEVKQSNATMNTGKPQRRWRRGTATAEKGEVDCVEAVRPPISQDNSSGSEDPASTADNGGQLARDVRRLQKALREIRDLEGKQSNGEKLRANQFQKLAKKEQYLYDLQLLSPSLAA